LNAAASRLWLRPGAGAAASFFYYTTTSPCPAVELQAKLIYIPDSSRITHHERADLVPAWGQHPDSRRSGQQPERPGAKRAGKHQCRASQQYASKELRVPLAEPLGHSYKGGRPIAGWCCTVLSTTWWRPALPTLAAAFAVTGPSIDPKQELRRRHNELWFTCGARFDTNSTCLSAAGTAPRLRPA
jgi:hypothetical protein